MHFEEAPQRLAQYSWRVLSSLPILYLLLDINLGREVLAYLHEFCSDGSNFTFVTCNDDSFLVLRSQKSTKFNEAVTC